MTVLRWATITRVSPLRIRLDGDTLEAPVAPDTLAADLPLGARVLCALADRRVIVLGSPAAPALPVGAVVAGAPPPGGVWLQPAGQALARADYPVLWARRTDLAGYGIALGAGDGATTLTLPDWRGRMLLTPSGTHAAGSTGGAETHRHYQSLGYDGTNLYVRDYTQMPASKTVNSAHAQIAAAPAAGVGRYDSTEDTTALPPFVTVAAWLRCA